MLDRSSRQAIFSTILLLSPLAHAASSIDCSHVRVDEVSYKFDSLKGPRTVHSVIAGEPEYMNKTFTIDLCAPLQRAAGDELDLKGCAEGANICGIDYIWKNGADKYKDIPAVRAIAGNFINLDGSTQDAKWTTLKDSASHSDSEREGLRLEFGGGKYPFKRVGIPQKAIIEFICDKKMTGLEGLNVWDEHFSGRDKFKQKRDEADDDDDSKDKALQFIRYQREGQGDGNKIGKGVDVLRLEWRTRTACADAESLPQEPGKDEDTPKKTSSWGFFTWFIIILFLSIAAYLIFGSWLNWNRYGARGWDLVPHGDTIRDLPYILKDWARRVIGAFQNGGSRGGYAAV